MRRWLYLHGFASGARSRKGVWLRERLLPAGIDLELLDLNVPSFETQTTSAALASLDRVDRDTPPGTRLALVGSSMGGYQAARWAELRPERVDRLLLLCPGFDLPSRWPLLLGAEAFERWEREGRLDVEDGTGILRPLHFRFVEDSRAHPQWPEVRCPTCIVHGTRDTIVPIEYSRRYAASRPNVRLVEVDDDHVLHESLERIFAEFLDLCS